MRFLLIALSFLCLVSAQARNVFDQEFKHLQTTSSPSISVVANNSRILSSDFSKGINIIYDKDWNELERHEAETGDITCVDLSKEREWYVIEFPDNTSTDVLSDWEEKRNVHHYNKPVG